MALNFANRKRKCNLDPFGAGCLILLSTDPDRKANIITGQITLEPLEGCLLQLELNS